MGTHVANVERFAGEVVFVPADPNRSHIQVDMDMTSLTTAIPPLTSVMRSPNFFDVQRFPNATFRSTRVAASSPPPGEAKASPGRGPEWFRVEGELSLHGVTKPIVFEAALVRGEDTGFLTARAELRLNRREFGVIYRGVLDPLIDDQVVVRLWAQGRPTRSELPASAE